MQIPRPRSRRRAAGRVLRTAGSIAVACTLALSAGCSSSDAHLSSAEDVPAPAGAYPGQKAVGSPVHIGLIVPEDGPASSHPEEREAAQAAAQYANDNLAGIAGHQIELVICKSKEDPASARDCANRMVESKVAAVVVASTSQGDAMAPVITGAGIPYVASSGSTPTELNSKNAFIWTGGYPADLAGMAAYAKQRGYKHVTAFVIDSGSIVSATSSIGGKAFDAAGVELTVIPVPPGTADSTPLVDAGLRTKPDAVALAIDPVLCTSVLESLETLGTTAHKMSLQACLDPSTQMAVGADAMEGASVFTTSDPDSDAAESMLYRSIMHTYTPSTPTAGFAPLGYQGMMALIRATQGVQGDLSPAAFATAIAAARDVPLPMGGGLTFTCDGTAVPGFPSVCSARSIVLTVVDGKGTNPQTAG
ncbi:ABC transporter substrate-binding protein [Rhodococcus opacus]|uniref:ABC transporter substrate-binding protein n=1 Tax=Rhodococcus opacus TaxID=37919 RepID=UPI001C44AD09|nr:ABC transporter substrate-binding protein [Rhodococcus opacus]MBV6756180.1 ABC transporter substrate-binding protein [Rhodococcus opacus]